MSILDLSFDDVVEPTPVEKSEYRLRVLGAEVKTSKAGNDYIAVTFEVVDEPNAARIYKNFMLPGANDDKETSNRRLLAIKRFLEAFDLNMTSPLDLTEWNGAEGWALVDIEHDDEYGDKNFVRRFIKQG